MLRIVPRHSRIKRKYKVSALRTDYSWQLRETYFNLIYEISVNALSKVKIQQRKKNLFCTLLAGTLGLFHTIYFKLDNFLHD